MPVNKQLRRSAVKGLGWAFFTSVSSQACQVLTTLVVAQLLDPRDFGVFALASIIVNALDIVSTVGFAQALVYRQGDTERISSTAFFMTVGVGLSLFSVLFVTAPWIAGIFAAPAVIGPIRAMAPLLIITGATAVPAAIMDKHLEFKKKAMSEVPGALASAVVAISLAAAGMRIWSLVFGAIVMTTVDVAITWRICSWRPKLLFSWEDARGIANYGVHLLAGIFAAFLFQQMGKAGVGKWLGMTALGYYSMAFSICNLPANNLAAVVNRVMFPTYAKVESPEEVREIYIRMLKHLSVIVFPLMAGLALISEPVIRIMYPKWVGAVPIFHVLVFYGLARSIGATADAVFMATNRTGLIRNTNFIQLLISGLLIYTAARHFGAVGVGVLFTAAVFTGTIYALANVHRLLGMEARSWLSVMWKPAAATVAGVIPVMLVFQDTSWSGILFTMVSFCLIYGSVVYLLDRTVYKEIFALARMAEGASS
jgi:O-antigen/teichoic acid export membrane protein